MQVDDESWNSASDPMEEGEGVDSKDFFKKGKFDCTWGFFWL